MKLIVCLNKFSIVRYLGKTFEKHLWLYLLILILLSLAGLFLVKNKLVKWGLLSTLFFVYSVIYGCVFIVGANLSGMNFFLPILLALWVLILVLFFFSFFYFIKLLWKY